MLNKKVIIIPDSFKGSMSSEKVAEVLNEIILQRKGCDTISIPIADGGEGSTRCILEALGGTYKNVRVHSPENTIINARYGITHNRVAVLEIAESSGITKQKALNPMTANTYGFGEMIKDALDEGLRDFFLCLGGSASTDCGCAMASALGMKFFDVAGRIFVPCGKTLKNVVSLDASDMDERIFSSRFTVMSDVENPLFGPLGAAHIFSPQKGANPDEVLALDSGLKHISDVMRKAGFKDPGVVKGAGAAGGAGYGCYAFLNAKIESGIDAMLDICRFDEKIEEAAYVVTGEGKLDEQSLMGKVVGGIHNRSKGKPLLVFCGINELSEEKLSTLGIRAVEIGRDIPVDESMKNAETYLRKAANSFFASLEKEDIMY